MSSGGGLNFNLDHQFDVKHFNKNFDKYAEQQRLKALAERPRYKENYENVNNEHKCFSLLDHVMYFGENIKSMYYDFKSNKSFAEIITVKDRLFYIGIFLILLALFINYLIAVILSKCKIDSSIDTSLNDTLNKTVTTAVDKSIRDIIKE